MILKIYAEPAIEPVSLQDMKEHLRLYLGVKFGGSSSYHKKMVKDKL